MAIRPYSMNACPSGVGRPSRPNIRNKSQARTWLVTSDPATRSISGHWVAILATLTVLRAIGSSGGGTSDRVHLLSGAAL